jgi:hypothetical protein
MIVFSAIPPASNELTRGSASLWVVHFDIDDESDQSVPFHSMIFWRSFVGFETRARPSNTKLVLTDQPKNHEMLEEDDGAILEGDVDSSLNASGEEAVS